MSSRRQQEQRGHSKVELRNVVVTTLIVLWLTFDLGAAFFLPMPTYVGSDIEFDLQITVPYTIAMPTWVGRKRRRRRHVTVTGNHHGRQVAPAADIDDRIGFERQDSNELDADGAVAEMETEPEVEEYDLSTREGAIVAQLDSLFDWMGLAEDVCRHRMLCYVSQQPDNYSPLSDVILQHLDPRREDLSVPDETQEPSMRRFGQFWAASRMGFESGTNCTLQTPACPRGPDQLLDWDTLRRVQQFARIIKLRFNDF